MCVLSHASPRFLLAPSTNGSPQFLAQKFETVFDKYNILLRSANYVTRRQSLKLLGELLLDRSNFQVMMRYIQASKQGGERRIRESRERRRISRVQGGMR